MIKFLLPLFLILISPPLLSQVIEVADSAYTKSISILNASQYKKGIYASFEEFRSNDPSILDSFYFDKKYLMVIDSTGEKRRIKKDEVWGFCNGHTIYAWWNKYNPIIEFGRYCYFTENGWRFTFKAPSTHGFPISILFIFLPTPYRERNIIDINDGQVYLLRNKLMREVLSDDPELLSKFNRTENKKEQSLKFLKEYNKRHIDQVE